MESDRIKAVEDSIKDAKKAIEKAEKLLNRATAEQMCKEFTTAGGEILQVLVKHLDWMEDSKDMAFDRMEIIEKPHSLTVVCEYK